MYLWSNYPFLAIVPLAEVTHQLTLKSTEKNLGIIIIPQVYYYTYFDIWDQLTSSYNNS